MAISFKEPRVHFEVVAVVPAGGALSRLNRITYLIIEVQEGEPPIGVVLIVQRQLQGICAGL